MSLSLSANKSYCGSRPIVGRSEDVWCRAGRTLRRIFTALSVCDCDAAPEVATSAQRGERAPHRRLAASTAARTDDGRRAERRTDGRTDMGARGERRPRERRRGKMDLFVIFVFHGSPATSNWLTDLVFDFRNFDSLPGTCEEIRYREVVIKIQKLQFGVK